MKQNLRVNCVYDDSGKDFKELIEESFKAYLERIFGNYKEK